MMQRQNDDGSSKTSTAPNAASMRATSSSSRSRGACGTPRRQGCSKTSRKQAGSPSTPGSTVESSRAYPPSGRRVIAAQSVMFPIAFSAGNTADRELKADDVAGISDIYGTSEFSREFGSISGRVTKNGAGVIGAHVVAFNMRTRSLVGGFTLSADGGFVIAGLEPGPHVLRVEPLDDGDIDSFFDSSLDVDINFNVKFHNRIVVVPRGGGTSNIEIRVTPK